MKRFYWLKDQNDRNAIIFEHCMCTVKSKKSFQNQIAKSEDSLYNQTTLLTMAILSILQARIFCPFPLEHK